MVDVKIEAGFFPLEPDYSVPSICWLAREILGAYMDEGVDLELGVDDMLSQHDDEGEEVEPRVHTTPLIQINRTQNASLSNLPYIVNNEGLLIPHTEPGYVALAIEPDENPPTDRALHLHKDCTQFIFRAPNSAREEEAAIFKGYTMDESIQIFPSETKRLKRIDLLLKCMRQGYRDLMDQSPTELENRYLSTVPCRPAVYSLLEELGIPDLGS
ncbi:MAG TPA: hypothetical protein VHD60_03105 [Candidatus Saccharimonadales bacterium]|nr:hypothetical protein [Candidatus Saccharimonadales bacterium]